MPDLTPTLAEQIAADLAADAAAGVQAATADGRTVTAMPVDDRIKAARFAANQAAAGATNAAGGPRSGWANTRPARVIPPGAV